MMPRQLVALAALSLIALAGGCCMCDAPYDYCGPTFLARPGEECVCDARMNSAFAPYAPYVAATGEVLEGDLAPAGEIVEPVTPAAEPGTSPSDAPLDQSLPRMSPQSAPATPSAPAALPRALDTTTQAPRGRPVSLRR